MQRRVLVRQMAPFDIPDYLPDVRHWFAELLVTLTWDNYEGDLIDSMEMEGPRTVLISMPDGDALVDEIVLLGFRTREEPGGPAGQPMAGDGGAKAVRENLGPMMAFRFYPIDDGNGTRVWASYWEAAMVVPLLFEEIVSELIEKQYPAVGPIWQQHQAKLVRQRLDIIERYVQTNSDAADRAADAGTDGTTEAGAGMPQAEDASAPAAQAAAAKQRRGPYRDQRKKLRAMWQTREGGVRVPFSVAWQDQALTYETVAT